MSNISPPTPELDKQRTVIDEGRAGEVQEFLDWLLDVQQVWLCRLVGEDFYDWGHTREQIMASYFGINLTKIEQERQALLTWIREQNARSEQTHA